MSVPLLENYPLEKYSVEPSSPYILNDKYLEKCIEGKEKYIPPYRQGIILPYEYGKNIEKKQNDHLEISGALHALEEIKLQAKKITIGSHAVIIAKRITLEASSAIIITYWQDPDELNRIRTTILAKEKLTILANALFVNKADIFEPKEYTINVKSWGYHTTPISEWLSRV
ncbi:MAG: hypothetical protein L0207_00820 [Chlamydiae bacterium]|nr:hypothetical protein [Chlamydiota bacterium]